MEEPRQPLIWYQISIIKLRSIISPEFITDQWSTVGNKFSLSLEGLLIAEWAAEVNWPFEQQMSGQLFPGPPMRKLSARTTTLSYPATLHYSEQRGWLPWQWRDLTDDALGSKRDAVDDEGAAHPLPQSLDTLNNRSDTRSADTLDHTATILPNTNGKFYRLINILVWNETWTTPALKQMSEK